MLRWVLLQISSLFFDKKYLCGRWFDNDFTGWFWVLRGVFFQKLLWFNFDCRFPVSPLIRVSNSRNIEFDPDNLDNFQQFGNYFQCDQGKIILGKGTYIAPNVSIITWNHDLNNLDEHLPAQNVCIGKNCWIGINSVILPGVTLGDHTIVGAGSIVTKSFISGNCIIAGNPAKIIKDI
jgi:hypothetical protein